MRQIKKRIYHDGHRTVVKFGEGAILTQAHYHADGSASIVLDDKMSSGPIGLHSESSETSALPGVELIFTSMESLQVLQAMIDDAKKHLDPLRKLGL